MIVAESAIAWLERYPRSSDGSERLATFRVGTRSPTGITSAAIGRCSDPVQRFRRDGRLFWCAIDVL